MYEKFFSFISQVITLNDELRTVISKNITRVSYPKKSILLREGEFHQNLYFIEKGILRTYLIKDNEDITSLFFLENDFLVSSFRFVNQPSYESIEVLEDATLLMLNYDDVLLMYKNHPEINYLGRVLIEQNYYRMYHRLVSMLKFSARERYEVLMKTQPEIFQRVPLTHIASYLGIKKESLSRIRKTL